MIHKFRAWIYDEEIMIYPGDPENQRNYYIRNDGKLFRIVKLSDKKGQNFLSIETKSEIMLSTGMIDKNGTEIFAEDWLGTLSSMSKVYYNARKGAWYIGGYERFTALKASKLEIVKNTFTK